MQIFNPLLPEFLSDPYPAYAKLRREEPIYRSDMLGVWVLTRYIDCEKVLRNHETFSSNSKNATGLIAALQAKSEAETGGPAARTILGSDPPEHTQLRSLINKAFTPRRVESMRSHVSDVATSLLDNVTQYEPFDLIANLAQPLPIIIIAEMLGVPSSDRERFKEWSKTIASMTSPLQEPGVTEKVAVARGELRKYFSTVIEQRRRHPRNDLISALVGAQAENDKFDDEELLGFCILLLVAGNETTTNLIGNGILALALHPDQKNKLCSRPDLMPSAVEEFFRYDSPVQATIRHTIKDTEIGGVKINKGQSVMAMIGAANRDPEQFRNPNKLDIERSDNRHLSLGHGIHYCLGAPLARIEAEIAFRTLLEKVPIIEIEEENMEYGGTFILRGVKRLLISSTKE